LPARNYATANINRDGAVNVVDLVGIVNMIFGLPMNPSPAPVNYNGQFATMKIVHDDLEAGQLTKLNVSGEFRTRLQGAIADRL